MGSRYQLVPVVTVLAACVIALDAREARACGGCFHPAPPPPPPPNIPNPPPSEVDTIVTEHRMAFALSTTQSVLWDQVRYSGNPKEFAWVLPVQQGTRVELSNDAWLAALDASTATVIQPPPEPSCPPLGGFGGGGVDYGGGSSPGGGGAAYSTPGPGGGGCACGFGGASHNQFSAGDDGSFSGSSGGSGGSSGTGGVLAGSSGGLPPPPPVTVQTQETVGPYDVVILRSSMGEALDAWLVANGFEIPPNIQPILDAYVAQHLDFVAMKLRPGANVNAMRPVRVIELGADPSLPLRMISAGAGAHVGLTLWVISEGRYQPQNFPRATVDFSQLVYDVGQVRSNYAELRAAALSPNAPVDAGTDAPPDAGTGGTVNAAVDAAEAQTGAESDEGGAVTTDAQPGSDAASGADAGTDAPSAVASKPGYWLTEYAGLVQLRSSGFVSSAQTPGLLDGYERACVPQTFPDFCEAGVGDSGPSPDAGDAAGGDAGNEASNAGNSTNASSGDASDDAAPEASDDSGDGGVADAGPVCTPPAPTVCDDPQVAFAGLHAGSIWVTRLVANLPASALGQDLVLEAEPTQTPVPNVHRAASWVDGDPCTLRTLSTLSVRIGGSYPAAGPGTDASGKSCALASKPAGDGAGVFVSLAAAALTIARSRRRRRSSGRGERAPKSDR